MLLLLYFKMYFLFQLRLAVSKEHLTIIINFVLQQPFRPVSNVLSFTNKS